MTGKNTAVIVLGCLEEEKDAYIKENNKLNLKTFMVDSFNDILNLLLKEHNYHFNDVFFSIESLMNIQDTSIHELINTVQNCAKIMNRHVPHMRVFMREEIDDIEFLRDLAKSQLLSIVYVPGTTEESRLDILKDCLDGKKFISPEILEMIKPKKTKKHRIDPNHIELTVRQQQVLKLIRERGASNKAIARTLKLSESTVKLHVGAILKKYNLTNRTQLALFTENKKKSKEDDRRDSVSVFLESDPVFEYSEEYYYYPTKST